MPVSYWPLCAAGTKDAWSVLERFFSFSFSRSVAFTADSIGNNYSVSTPDFSHFYLVKPICCRKYDPFAEALLFEIWCLLVSLRSQISKAEPCLVWPSQRAAPHVLPQGPGALHGIDVSFLNATFWEVLEWWFRLEHVGLQHKPFQPNIVSIPIQSRNQLQRWTLGAQAGNRYFCVGLKLAGVALSIARKNCPREPWIQFPTLFAQVGCSSRLQPYEMCVCVFHDCQEDDAGHFTVEKMWENVCDWKGAHTYIM